MSYENIGDTWVYFRYKPIEYSSVFSVLVDRGIRAGHRKSRGLAWLVDQNSSFERRTHGSSSRKGATLVGVS